MKAAPSSHRKNWSWRAVFAIALIGIGFAVTENIFPSLRSQSHADTFCAKVKQGMLFQEVEGIASADGYKLASSGPSPYIKLSNGCVCSFEITDGKVAKSAALCND